MAYATDVFNVGGDTQGPTKEDECLVDSVGAEIVHQAVSGDGLVFPASLQCRAVPVEPAEHIISA